jgi:NAD(P)-dependent dehydrogenase (short-subunit alcohol dehydrogenase family)
MGTVFITGASRGIGAHVAAGLASDGHEEVRQGAASPDLVLDAIREAISAEKPAFRFPLGALGEEAASMRQLPDDDVLAIMTEIFGLEEWMAQGSEVVS